MASRRPQLLVDDFGVPKLHLGVVRTRVGYCGGKEKTPTYHSIGSHTETIQIDFDPNEITYMQILDVFAKTHNIFHKKNYVQYKSAIFFMDETQKKVALEWKEKNETASKKNVGTDILPATHFTIAEDYHQKYRVRHSSFWPFFEKLSYLELVDDFAAAKLNGFVVGSGSLDSFKHARDRLAKTLNEPALKKLENLIKEKEDEL